MVLALCIITRKLISESFPDITYIHHCIHAVGQSMHTQRVFYWVFDRARVDRIASQPRHYRRRRRRPRGTRWRWAGRAWRRG